MERSDYLLQNTSLKRLGENDGKEEDWDSYRGRGLRWAKSGNQMGGENSIR
jgi:hypothetical protein